VIEYYQRGSRSLFHQCVRGRHQRALDTGAIKGWTRTGQTFRAYPVQQAGTSPVCRFYLPPINGDSHFYSASPTECADVHRRFPTFDLESSAVMHVALPTPTRVHVPMDGRRSIVSGMREPTTTIAT
jgi:hypothetical protein